MDAAVRTAASAHDLAVLRAVDESPLERRYELTSFRDEPGSLRVTLMGDAKELVDVREARYECRIGRFGDPSREASFIESIRSWRRAHTR